MIQGEKEILEQELRQQKQQLHMLNVALSNTVDFNYVFDLDGRFLYVNKPLLELWGKTLEEAVGKNFEELGYPPHLVHLHELQLQEVLLTKRPVKGENAYTNPQGKTGYYEYTFVPVFDENGNIEAIAGSTHDVTEKKLAEEKKNSEEAQRVLREQMHDQYLHALESADVPMGIVILEGANHRITFVNPVLTKIWGRTKEQVLDRPLFEALPELEGQVFKALLHGVYTTGIPYFGTELPAVFLIDGKQETVYFNFVYSPIHNEQGIITGIFVTAIDVTAQVQAKERLAEEQKRFYDFLQASPAAAAIIRGEEHVYELANERYQQLVGKTAEQLLGQPGRKALPELTLQGIWDVFDAVYNTGTAFYGNEFPAQLDRLGNGRLDQGYFNFVAQPLRNEQGEVERIFIHAYEVTEQVLARKKVEESEERYHTLFESIDEGFCIVEVLFDEQGKPYDHRFLEANPAYEKQAGLRDAVGKTIRELIPELNAFWFETFGRVALTGEPERFENVAEGLNYYHIFDVYAFRVGKPEEHHVAILFNDTTQRRQAEAALQQVTAQQEETLALLESLLKNAPIGFAFFDRDHRYIRINEMLAEINGIAANEHIGKAIEDLFPEIANMVVPILEKVVDTKEPVVDLEIAGATPKEPGITRYWLTGFYPVFIGKSKTVDVVGSVVIEITTLKKLEQQKDEFLAVASHELKTPVTSIKAYTQVLQKLFQKKGDMQSFELLAKMDGQINKLIALIADLLDVSKVQAGKLQLHLTCFDFEALVAEVVDEVQRTATHHTLHIERAESKMVYADRDRIGQVIVNLLTNAIKYSPDAESVIVQTRGDQETITLSVQDFGLGIPKEKQANVFEQFYRVEGRKENIYPGLGLGLYISSEIVRRHGGTIGVESEEGKGSTFYFTLPTRTRAPERQEDMIVEEGIIHE